jgi:hypothetical protein
MPVELVCANSSCRAESSALREAMYTTDCETCGSLMLPKHDFLTAHKTSPGASSATKTHVASTMSNRRASLSPSHGSIDLEPPDGPTLGEGERPRQIDLEAPFMGSYGEDHKCITCDNKDTHMLPLGVSWITQSTCARIAEMCLQAGIFKHGAKGKMRGFMLGVLEADNRLFVTTSGEVPQALAKILSGQYPMIVVCDGTLTPPEAPPRTKPGLKKLPKQDNALLAIAAELVTAPALRKTAGGAKIDSVRLNEVTDRTPARLFECAAPKLVSHALHNVLGTVSLKARNEFNRYVSWSMTEMWVGPSDGYHRHGVTYASCANCQQILPMMLCSRAPTSLVDDQGWTTATTKAGKKAAKRGDKVI